MRLGGLAVAQDELVVVVPVRDEVPVRVHRDAEMLQEAGIDAPHVAGYFAGTRSITWRSNQEYGLRRARLLTAVGLRGRRSARPS